MPIFYRRKCLYIKHNTQKKDSMAKKVVKLKEEAVKEILDDTEEADFSEEIFDGLEALA